MPTLPDVAMALPRELWLLVGLAIGLAVAWGVYSVPQYFAIEYGWPRVYHAAPYTGFLAGVLMYVTSVEMTGMEALLGGFAIWLFVDAKLAGPGYEHGRELYLEHGDGWEDEWDSAEVRV